LKRILSGRVEVVVPAIAVVLTAVGALNSYSATYYYSGAGLAIYLKQLIWFGIGSVAALLVYFMNESALEEFAFPLYVLLVISLLLVLAVGKSTGGARRWLSFGPINLQPSEMGKIVIVIFLSRFFSDIYSSYGLSIRDLFKPLLFVAIPFGLILLQPDLGTGGLYILIFCALAFVACLRLRSILTLVGLALVSLPVLWTFMKDYQKKRVLTFLSPERDPFGSGYHVIQSKIAIGSGGFFGKGFLNGTQGQLRFLPEQHTDFAFSVFAEEWGFIFCMILILLFLIFILRIFYIATQVQNRFSSFVITGVGVYFLLQFFINLAMVMGMFPVVGVPLPFISYGGSSMITSMIAVGIVMNQSKRRYLL